MWNVALFVGIGLLLDWRTATVLGSARVAGSVIGHWFIGYWTHAHGPKRFSIDGASEEGTNSTVLGWISFGEGYHNNHHALPDSARMGVTRFEFDLGWLVVVCLERLGWARDVKSWSRGNIRGRIGTHDTGPRSTGHRNASQQDDARAERTTPRQSS